jgi:hypothetical protein
MAKVGHRRQQALEPLTAFGQLGREPRALGVNLGADVVRHQADDPLAVLWPEALAGILQPAGQAVDPEPPVGVQHHFDDAGVFQPAGDRWPKGGPQHPGAARPGFRVDGCDAHRCPPQTWPRDR